MKTCCTCKEVKDFTFFNKDRKNKDGHCSQCKECKKKYIRPEHLVEKQKIRSTIRNRFKWSGFTEEDYKSRLEEQDNKCAICGSENPNHADHDHATGIKRGILCKKCNTGIAYLQENVEVLTKAIDYINRYSPADKDQQ